MSVYPAAQCKSVPTRTLVEHLKLIAMRYATCEEVTVKLMACRLLFVVFSCVGDFPDEIHTFMIVDWAVPQRQNTRFFFFQTYCFGLPLNFQ